MYNIIVRRNHGLTYLVYLTEITVDVYKLCKIHLEVLCDIVHHIRGFL